MRSLRSILPAVLLAAATACTGDPVAPHATSELATPRSALSVESMSDATSDGFGFGSGTRTDDAEFGTSSGGEVGDETTDDQNTSSGTESRGGLTFGSGT